MADDVLEVRDLRKTYREGARVIEAVRGVSFSLAKGEITGIVGASGCGKSTLLQMLAGLESPCAGTISFAGTVLTPGADGWGNSVYRQMQLIFQNPLEAFSPRMTIGEFLVAPLRAFGIVEPKGEAAALSDMLARARLETAAAERLPHQLSGGQLQRVVLIRALFVRPELLLFDEPTSALDVVTQESVLSFIEELHRAQPFTGLFVTHDLAVVRRMTTTVFVMERGEIVERLPASRLRDEARHPFTKRLLAAQLPHRSVI